LSACSNSHISFVVAVLTDNPFHNFEHASHVTLSVVKLMSRIVAPDLVTTHEELKSSLHDHTYGITSDPLTQFACVFSALIHDVDHTGVPNSQLLKENAKLALYYKERSVAEQNSVDLSWDLLMDDNFKDLRAVIYRTDEERKRFRELVVNSVMATDIMDKDLKKLRNERWEKAFSGTHLESENDAFDRKATIVIEHLIQASDISHTMQHWHIYRKWNTRLFEEMHRAFVDGRADKSPADFWYQGEIGFFDFYIIPLAKKLKDCGVFGVSCDEYLNYAMKNRQEWEERGQEIVAEMAQAVALQSRAKP
jgi:3'5'-cyclic nucleotide phosphodiesterase